MTTASAASNRPAETPAAGAVAPRRTIDRAWPPYRLPGDRGSAVGYGHREGAVGGPGDGPGQGRRDGGAGDGQDQHERAGRLGGYRPDQVALKLVAMQQHDCAATGGRLA